MNLNKPLANKTKTMNKQGIVTDQVEIKASVGKVWEVLTQTKYYKQWDELPEDFTANELNKEDVLK